MIGNRAANPRPYLFEILIAASFLATALLASPTRKLLGSIPTGIATFAVLLLADAVIGVTIRSIVAAVRRDSAYFRIIRSTGWLLDTARIIFFGAVATLTYAWLKLIVPIVHPRLYDRQLWEIDAMLLGGYSPTVLSLELFSNDLALKVIDWTYPNIFFASISVAFVFFISHPSRRIRVAFTTGKAILGLAGAALYLLVPSLGPAYRFPEVWLVYSDLLVTTQHLQGMLLTNYQNVLRAMSDQPHGVIQPIFGIAAFPSLHVALQLFMFLWMRRLWKSGEVLFGIFFFMILLGSVVTGWHYLIDGIAGIVLAWAAYAAAGRLYGLDRWLGKTRN
ncbi:MAG: phosphatase PAP2 family protein [Thermoanaerobaculia bacterium]